MPLAVSIKALGLIPKITPAQIAQLQTDGMAALAYGWHASYSPGKFTPAGARKYNYTKRRTKEVRTGRIKKSKSGRKLAPNGNPLVWTGRSRSLAKSKTVRASPTLSSVTSPIRAFNFKPKGAYPGLNMRFEYKRVLQDEQQRLGKGAERVLRDRFSKSKKNINVIFSRTI